MGKIIDDQNEGYYKFMGILNRRSVDYFKRYGVRFEGHLDDYNAEGDFIKSTIKFSIPKISNLSEDRAYLNDIDMRIHDNMINEFKETWLSNIRNSLRAEMCNSENIDEDEKALFDMGMDYITKKRIKFSCRERDVDTVWSDLDYDYEESEWEKLTTETY